jgi:hypothetical protein
VQPRLTGASHAKSSCGSARRADQMSVPPQPPGRSLPKKISRPSLEKVIALSSPALLSAPTLRGGPHASRSDRRWMTYRSERSKVPTDPGRSEPKKRLSPSGDTLGRCSFGGGVHAGPEVARGAEGRHQAGGEHRPRSVTSRRGDGESQERHGDRWSAPIQPLLQGAYGNAPSCIGPGCPENLPNRRLENPLVPDRATTVPQSCVFGTSLPSCEPGGISALSGSAWLSGSASRRGGYV